MSARIYKVTNKINGDSVLVEAGNRTGAINYMAASLLDAEVCSQRDLVEMIQAGLKVNSALKAQAPDDGGDDPPATDPDPDDPDGIVDPGWLSHVRDGIAGAIDKT